MATLPKTPAPQGKRTAVGFWNSVQLVGAAAITVPANTETRSAVLDGSGFAYVALHTAINIPAGGTAHLRVIYVDPETGADVDPLSPPGVFTMTFFNQAGPFNAQAVGFFPDVQTWLFRIGFIADVQPIDFTNPRLWMNGGGV